MSQKGDSRKSNMKITGKRYTFLLSVQTLLFATDFLINILTPLVRQNNGISLILFIIQSACLILSLAILFVTVFSTYAFQAGLLDLLYEKFHVSLMIFISYFIVTILLQIWFLIAQWSTSLKFVWSTPLFVLFIFQRTLTPFYYYYYKRASLRISDPRFYEDVWNENNLQNTS